LAAPADEFHFYQPECHFSPVSASSEAFFAPSRKKMTDTRKWPLMRILDKVGFVWYTKYTRY